MFKPGDMFGDYRVLRRLGKGGMGEVWLLEIEARKQLFAVKIMDPDTSGDHRARKRFAREAELAMGVKHPNLVEVYDIGEDPETGLCYMLMEYVPGGTLADRLRRDGALGVTEALEIVRRLADVLELVRRHGIVHRDIKPDNVMFGRDGCLKLADLGIARAADSNLTAAAATTVTQGGAMIGTPAYMAPEQMFDPHSVDIRADVYSLGVVLYEMLSGERPYKNDTAIQLMAKAVRGEPLPDVRALRTDVPEAVARLVAGMTAKRREERLATPRAVVDACEAILSGAAPAVDLPLPVAAVAPAAGRGDPVPCGRLSARRPFVLAGVLAVAMALGVAAWVAAERSGRIARAEEVSPERLGELVSKFARDYKIRVEIEPGAESPAGRILDRLERRYFPAVVARYEKAYFGGAREAFDLTIRRLDDPDCARGWRSYQWRPRGWLIEFDERHADGPLNLAAVAQLVLLGRIEGVSDGKDR